MQIVGTDRVSSAQDSRTRSLKRARYIGVGVRYTVLSFFALLCLFPFVYAVLSSFKSSSEIIQIPPTFFPRTPTLASYRSIFSDFSYDRYFFNSVLVTGLSVVAALFTSAAAGFVFAKYRFFGRDQLFVLLLSTLMIPFSAILVPLFLEISDFGWINSYQGLVIPTMVTTFGIFMMRQFISNIPSELMEAARIDGASELRIFATIILPLATSALAVLGILHFFAMWDSFLWPLAVVNDQSMRTFPLALAALVGEHGPRYDLQTAASVTTNIPVLLVYVLAQRKLTRGISLTGAKM